MTNDNAELPFETIGDVAAAIVAPLAGEKVWDGTQITEPGVYAGIGIDAYHNDTKLLDGFSISSTGIRQIIRRPLEYWYQSPHNPDRVPPEDTDYFSFGRAAHMLLLGEEGFAERYVLRPTEIDDKPWQGNRSVCKQWLKDTRATGRSVITDTDLVKIKLMAESMSKHSLVREGILDGRVERSIFTKLGDVWLKSRPDNMTNASGMFADLKTAASVDPEDLQRTIYNSGYHIQAAVTKIAVQKVLGESAFSSFIFVFVEKDAPFDVVVKELKTGNIDLGCQQVLAAIKTVEECLKTGEWPGYDGRSPDGGYIEMPSWAATRIENNLKFGAAA